jgi:hypothetical protein
VVTAYEEFRDVGIPSAQASVQNLATAIQAITFPQTEDGEPDSSKSKHGKIIVGEPELREGKLGKLTSHHVYKVSCSAGAVEHVFRRYTDFIWLRNTLVKAFPGIFIPPLPPKPTQLLGARSSMLIPSVNLTFQPLAPFPITRATASCHFRSSYIAIEQLASWDPSRSEVGRLRKFEFVAF